MRVMRASGSTVGADRLEGEARSRLTERARSLQTRHLTLECSTARTLRPCHHDVKRLLKNCTQILSFKLLNFFCTKRKNSQNIASVKSKMLLVRSWTLVVVVRTPTQSCSSTITPPSRHSTDQLCSLVERPIDPQDNRLDGHLSLRQNEALPQQLSAGVST